MDKNINYYGVLGITNIEDSDKIKLAYRNLSKIYHPDISKEENAENIFKDICKAYSVLSNKELKEEYDLKSKFGKNYNEYFELFDIKVDISYDDEKIRFETFKKNEVWNIQIDIDDTFSGNLEYERWVKCKTCDGTGKDLKSKIVIKDALGNITKMFDPDDGCDFCEGSGKDYKGDDCGFCGGKGEIGLTPCKKCNGERRILGKQKLNGVKLTGAETKIEAMGHHAKNEPGKVGYLLLIINNDIK
jgi:molecular chaperone DnaJ